MKKNYLVKLDTNKVFNHVLFSYDDFNMTCFINFIMENFHLNSTYSILVKFGFSGNSVFYMSGRQIGIKIGDSHDIDYYKNIYNIIILRVEDVISKYDVESLPNSIVISYKSLINPKSLVMDNIKSISINKSIINKVDQKKIFSTNYLPLTINNNYFGFLVEKDLKFQYIERLLSKLRDSGMSLPSILTNLDLIKNSNVFIKKVRIKNNFVESIIIDCVLKDYIFYTSKAKDINNTNFVDIENLNSLVKSYSLNDKGFIRIVFDLNTGILLCTAIDLIVTQDIFIRQINNIYLTISKNQVIDISRSLNLDYIKPSRFNSGYMSNPNIGALDLETFTNSQGLGQVYSIGYGTISDSNNIKTFYLTDLGPSLNSNLLIINCVNSMLESKYNNYFWYIHNMGKFDIVYIHKCLEEYNLNSKEEFFKLNTIYKDGKMLRLVVKRKINNKTIKITFLDSLNILNGSLSNLTKDFQVKALKGIFPYSFVNEKTLNYVGETPDMKYFNNVSLSDYQNIYSKNNWALKEESLKYLKNDILGLLEVLEKFKSKLFLEHNLDLTEGLTISRLALNKYLKYYLNDSKIPLINKLNIFNFIYQGYFGGRTEVFKPHGYNLYYYDVNSLYPTVALNNMPGLNVSYKKSFTEEGLDIDNLFGVFKAKVKTNNNYLGLLPVKIKEGLIFPNGDFEGIWPSPELKFAKEQGYDIKVSEGYAFEQIPSYFKDYILDLYELKSNTTGFEQKINKSLLNNLLGRFGLSIVKPVTKIVNSQNLDLLMSTRKIKSLQEITKNTFLVNYIPIVDSEVCLDHGVDYLKVLTENNNNSNIEKNIDIFEDVSVIISAIVTSYARIFMLKIFIEILKAGGNIYYTDTDSVVTDIPLDKISSQLIGKGLAQFKLEYVIKEAYFISNKTYCLVLNDNSTVIKCKGIQNNSLTLDDFKSMYLSSKNIYATKTTTITNLSKGSVTIEDKKILLQHDAYTKRSKEYNDKGIWVNTKPLFYNNIGKSIIPYTKPI